MAIILQWEREEAMAVILEVFFKEQLSRCCQEGMLAVRSTNVLSRGDWNWSVRYLWGKNISSTNQSWSTKLHLSEFWVVENISLSYKSKIYIRRTILQPEIPHTKKMSEFHRIIFVFIESLEVSSNSEYSYRWSHMNNSIATDKKLTMNGYMDHKETL